MNELTEQVKELKNSILKIAESLNDSEPENQALAFKAFVYTSLDISLKTFISRYEQSGVSKDINHACNFKKHLSIDKALLTFDDVSKEFENLDVIKIFDSVLLYAHIVKTNEPYTDVMSALAEEFLLSRGRGTAKGQFITPIELSQAIAELMDNRAPADEPVLFGDICVGYGALMLARINRQYNKGRKSLKKLRIVVNDVDRMACNVATLQVLMNTIQHDLDIASFTMLCSDAIKDWRTEKPFVISYETPQCVFDHYAKIREEQFKALDCYDLLFNI